MVTKVSNICTSHTYRYLLRPTYLDGIRSGLGITPRPRTLRDGVKYSTTVPLSASSSLDIKSTYPDSQPPASPTFSWESDLDSSPFLPITSVPTRNQNAPFPEDVVSSEFNSPRALLFDPPAPPPSPASVPPSRGQQVKVPEGHYTITYNAITVILPCSDTNGPFFVITRGKVIGIVATW